MPRRPNSGMRLAISDGFDDAKNYRVKLNEIEERESQYADAKKGSMALVWKMSIYDENGVAFEDTSTGLTFELWGWTGDSTFANASTGQRSKARQYTEAFMGRELSDDEINELIDAGFENALVGKVALASLEIVTTTEGSERISILKLRPVRDQAAQRAPTLPPSPPSPPSTTRQQRIDEA
jgi:hypothetical protein